MQLTRLRVIIGGLKKGGIQENPGKGYASANWWIQQKSAHFTVETAENGQVHSGDRSMKYDSNGLKDESFPNLLLN